jgi:hypothetical protein
MPTKQVGAVYLVDIACFDPAVRGKYRQTVSEHEGKCKVVPVKILGMIPRTRSYECQVVGIGDKVKLSSKSLSQVQINGQRTNGIEQPKTVSEDECVPDEGSGSESSGEDAPETDAVDTTRAGFADVVAADWRPVAAFDDQIVNRHASFDIDQSGRLRCIAGQFPIDFFGAFFPMVLLEARFSHWRAHTQENDRRGLTNLNTAMFGKFLALLLRMGLGGLRRRRFYFTEHVEAAAMSQTRTFCTRLVTPASQPTRRDKRFQTVAQRLLMIL